MTDSDLWVSGVPGEPRASNAVASIEELREMVRDSIARVTRARSGIERSSGLHVPASGHTHASFRVLPLVSGDEAGMCLIEPVVRCNHCGYCLSYGH